MRISIEVEGKELKVLQRLAALHDEHPAQMAADILFLALQSHREVNA